MRQRIRSHLTFANVASLVALFVALGGTTYAATGGNFILGKSNSASSTTSLTAPVAGKGLQVTNTSTGAGATALGLNVASGHAPFTVNSATKVSNLNADKLDGIDSTGFLPSSNVKSLRFITPDCTGSSDPGCSTTFTLGGLGLEADCYTSNGGTVSNLDLYNASLTSKAGIEYVSGGSASQHIADPGTPLVQLTNATPQAQGSVINLDTNKPETANLAMGNSVALGMAHCELWVVGVKPR